MRGRYRLRNVTKFIIHTYKVLKHADIVLMSLLALDRLDSVRKEVRYVTGRAKHNYYAGMQYKIITK